MKYTFISYLIASVVFATFFYVVPFRLQIDEKIFLTVSTFFFAIFAGFFISRQGQRYSSIRDKLTTFDGSMSFIYRSLNHFGPSAQEEGGMILKHHYLPILEKRLWDYPFTHKTTTLTDFHALLERFTKDKSLTSIQNAALTQAMVALREAQQARKNLIALEEEHVPYSHWILMSFLGALLIVALLAVPSYTNLVVAFLKGAFGGITIFVLIILWKLDRLEFFEGAVGEQSARDVLSIIEGKR